MRRFLAARVLAPVLLCTLATAALAQAAAAPAATWSPGELYAWLAQNVFVPVIGGLVLAALGWLGNLLQKKWHITLSDSFKADIQQAVMDAAGRIFASQDAFFAHAQIDVHSALIAKELPKIEATTEKAITGLNLTPDNVKDLVLAKVGQLQAQAQAGAPQPAAEDGK